MKATLKHTGVMHIKSHKTVSSRYYVLGTWNVNNQTHKNGHRQTPNTHAYKMIILSKIE